MGIVLMTYQSYALWTVTKESGESIVSVGCFEISYQEESNTINLENTYPMSDEKGLTLTPYTFTITNTCTTGASYEVTLNTLTTNTMNTSWLKYALYKEGETKPTTGINLGTVTNKNTQTEELQIPNLNESLILTSGELNGRIAENQNGESVTYHLYLWMDETTGNEAMNTTFEGSINIISSAINKTPNAAEYITLLANTSSEIVNDETADQNLRYIGADPNNYVTFNNESWRIIGVMNNIDDGTGVKETRLKIIKEKPYSEEIAWDAEDENDWSVASLQEELNGPYLESIKSPSNKMINNAIWNLGGSITYDDVTASLYYERERGTEVYSGHKTKWIGKIGLIYASDYGYATSGGSTTNRDTCLNTALYNWNSSIASDCRSNDWLYDELIYQWTITPWAGDSRAVVYLRASGTIHYHYAHFTNVSIYPVLYLSSNVRITSGDGSSSSPFVLTM